METRKYTVYTWDELSDEGKERAVEKHWDINVHHEWYDFIYDEAKELGFTIEGWDYGRYCRIRVNRGLTDIASNIIRKHGATCETYIDAKNFILGLEKAGDNEDVIEELQKDFERALKEDYRIMLDKEYDYLTSSEAIAETLRLNEYLFTESGAID